MKLFITGREGQVARALTEAAKSQDISAIALGRPDFDLTQSQSIHDALERHAPSIVVNTAAYTAVDKAEQEKEVAIAVNHHGAKMLAMACAERDLPLIHISTDYVYDGSKDSAYVESDKTAPLGVYGQSKRAGEQAVIAATPHHIILRTAWVYSPFGNNFVKTMLRLAKSHEEVGVVSDQVGSPTYAPHLADAILEIAKQIDNTENTPHWGIYHAAGCEETSWHDMAEKVFEQAALLKHKVPKLKAITTQDYPTPAKRPANSRLNCRRLEQNFSVTLPRWQKGVSECVTRLLSH